MPFAELTTGATLHYEDTALDQSGIPVIVIHGLLGTAKEHFSQVMAWLSHEGYRVVGPSLRGYGQSTPKPRDFPYRFYHRDTEDLIAFMDALNIDKAHLLGYSDGGEVALIAAGAYPDRCQSVIAIGAVGNFGPELRPVFQRSYPGTWITEGEKQLHGIEDANAFARGWVQASTRMLDAGGDVSLSKAHQATCPVMIVLGQQDTLNPEKYAHKFVEKTPNGQVQMFPCGHGVHIEMFDAFKNTIGPFLKQANP